LASLYRRDDDVGRDQKRVRVIFRKNCNARSEDLCNAIENLKKVIVFAAVIAWVRCLQQRPVFLGFAQDNKGNFDEDDQ